MSDSNNFRKDSRVVDDVNKRYQNVKTQNTTLLAELRELAGIQDEFTARIRPHIERLERFEELDKKFQAANQALNQEQENQRKAKEELEKHLRDYKNAVNQLSTSALLNHSDPESNDMINPILELWNWLRQKAESCRELLGLCKQKETELEQSKSDLRDQIPVNEDELEPCGRLILEVKVSRRFSDTDFRGRFDLCPLNESPITQGEVEQYHAVVTTFEPLKDKQYIDVGLTLDAQCIPFYPGIEHRVKTLPGNNNKISSNELTWRITLDDVPYLDIRFQHNENADNKVEASWDENIRPEKIAIAHSLLFSVIRFTISKKVTTESGSQEFDQKSQFCQLLAPGTLNIAVHNVSIPVQEDDEVLTRFDLATVRMEGLEFVKEPNCEKWLVDTLHQGDGKYVCAGFSGDASIKLNADAVRPEIVLTGNYRDQSSQDLRTAESRIRLAKRIDGEKVSLVLFEHKTNHEGLQDEETQGEISRPEEPVSEMPREAGGHKRIWSPFRK